jgi:hypothetical protein
MACLCAGVVLTACWLPQAAPLPNGPSTQLNFSSLACPSASFCVAAGTYLQPVDGSFYPFFDVLASDAWTSSTAPLPSDADGDQVTVNSVACISAGSCVAVGSYSVPGGGEGLIETLADGAWTATVAPVPGDANPSDHNVVLQSVSCGSDGTCAAIGQYLGADIEDPSPVIETLSGGTWSATAPPVPADAGTLRIPTMLSGVSCASAGACVVIGSYTGTSDYGALVETLSAGQWVPIDAPSPGQLVSLNAVSCIASGTCVVVGSFGDSGPLPHGLIDTLSGGTWNTQEAPSPGGDGGTVTFTSVSCASDDTCAAVGDYAASANAYLPFADSLVGGTWSTTAIPFPDDAATGNFGTFPGPVSCAPDLHCTVVGSYYVSVGAYPFAYIASTSGGAWSSIRAPLPAGASGANTSWVSLISCPSSVLCFGLGGYAANGPAMQIIETGFNVPGFSVGPIGASLRP